MFSVSLRRASHATCGRKLRTRFAALGPTGDFCAKGSAVGAALLCTLLSGCSPERTPEVLDCRAGPCARRVLDRATECGEGARMSICSEPEAVFRRVRLLADADNYVAGPFTEAPFDVEIVDAALTQPWDLEFLPDGSMLITERGGAIHHLAGGSLRKLKSMRLIIAKEAGLLGLAIDPDFADNGFVYVYYTYDVGKHERGPSGKKLKRTSMRVLNRVSRLHFRDGGLHDERVILNRIPGSVIHSGGRLEFGPDGKLYVTTGDGGEDLRSGDPAFHGGKILRIERDGSIPSDNPYANNPVYSRGHRNPQGLAWHPETGALYASEHGDHRHDEVNRVDRGADHGWPYYECDGPRRPDALPPESIVLPVVCFDSYTMAPSGMTFVADSASPWYGSLFVSGLRGRHLRRFEFDGDEIAREEIFYVSDGVAPGPARPGGQDLRLRDVEYSNGALWVIGDGWGLAKLTPSEASR